MQGPRSHATMLAGRLPTFPPLFAVRDWTKAHSLRTPRMEFDLPDLPGTEEQLAHYLSLEGPEINKKKSHADVTADTFALRFYGY